MNSGKISRNKYDYEIVQNINSLQEIPEKYTIRDQRKIEHFKKQTFGGYSRTDVLGQLTKAIKDEKLEEACHWGLQILLSGQIHTLWDKLLVLAYKTINIGNTRLPQFICNRYISQMNISQSSEYKGEKSLMLRNIQNCRNYLTEFICLMVLSRKNKVESLPKIQSQDFNVGVLKSKLTAPDTVLINNIIKPNDPNEISIVCNEFANQINKRYSNNEKAFYWICWMVEWEKLNVKRYKKYECGYRGRPDIKEKFHRDMVWLIWEIILAEAVRRNNNKLAYQINALWRMYIHNFSLGCKSRKLNLILWAVKFLTNPLDWKIPICDRFYLLFQATANINLMIKHLKKNELRGSIYKDAKFNVLTRNNYVLPTNYQQLEKNRKLKEMEKAHRELKSKKPVISGRSLSKMKKVQEIDSIMRQRHDNYNANVRSLNKQVRQAYVNPDNYNKAKAENKKQFPLKQIKTKRQKTKDVIKDINKIINISKPTWGDYGF